LPTPFKRGDDVEMTSDGSNPLIARIQTLFQRDLALENDSLRQENQILRSKLGARVPLTDADRRILVRFGLRIKERLHEIASIASPESRAKWTFDNTPRMAGRPRKSPEAEALVVNLAEENSAWGYTRIAGELKKLGHIVSPSLVRDVLRRHGLPTAPNRKGATWKQFIQSHLDVTWAADFFAEEVLPCRCLIHDRDSVFIAFDAIIRTDGIVQFPLLTRITLRTPRRLNATPVSAGFSIWR
jgi:putative transposase